MSERFAAETDDDAMHEALSIYSRENGGITVMALMTNKARQTSMAAVIDLPAPDARRLRDWLNERYPVTETGER